MSELDEAAEDYRRFLNWNVGRDSGQPARQSSNQIVISETGFSTGEFPLPVRTDVTLRGTLDGTNGACCYDDGTCDDLTEADCDSAGGNWQGPDTTCDDDPPPCVGVCCEESGCVDDSTPDSCAADGGTWTDFGTTCADDPPPCPTGPTGACCVDGVCSITSEVDCTGHYLGDGSTCDGVDCTQGACCVEGVCSITSEEECLGVYQGDGTTCAGVDCTKGACCVGGVCSQTTEAGCTGTFQGLGTPCVPDPCTACTGCAFFNSEDGRYYLVRKRFSHAEFHAASPPPSIDVISDTVKVSRCTEGGIDCSESHGTGTFDYDAPSIEYHCHCDDTYFCNDPIEAAGFYGLNGLTFTYECSSTPDNDPGCGSGVLLLCDFGECTETAHTVYSIPCIFGGFSPPP